MPTARSRQLSRRKCAVDSCIGDSRRLRLTSTAWSTTTQITALGVPARTLRDWAAAGRLHRVHRGVYAVGHRPLTPHARWLAAVLACGTAVVALPPLERGAAGGSAGLGRWGGRHGSRVASGRGATGSRSIVPTCSFPARSPSLGRHSMHHSRAHPRRPRIGRASGFRRVRDTCGAGEAPRDPRPRSPPSLPIFRDAGEPVWSAGSSASPTKPRTTPAAATSAASGGSSSVPGCRLHEATTGLPSRPTRPVGSRSTSPGRDRRVAVEIDSATYHETERAFVNDPARNRHLMLAGWRPIRFSDRDLIDRPSEVGAQMLALAAVDGLISADELPQSDRRREGRKPSESGDPLTSRVQ